MGTMALSDFREELNFLLKRRNDVDATNSTRVDRWVNQAYVFLCHPGVHKFREMQDIDNLTLATSDNDYSITTLGSSPANTVVAIRFVTYVAATSFSNTATKRKVNPRSIRQFEQKTLSSGPPVEYAIDGEVLFINAVPRSTENGHLLRVGYYKEPAVLSEETDATVLPSYYDRPILKVAQAFAEADLQDRDLSLLTLREATGLMNVADENEMEAEDDGQQVEVVLQNAMGPA